MFKSVPVHFYLADAAKAVSREDPAWGKPLPMNRQGKGGGFSLADAPFTYGDYFDAIARFLTEDGTVQALFEKWGAGDDGFSEPVAAIHVFEEKHGAFYHPARIGIDKRSGREWFVLNVALSEAGNRAVAEEFATLRDLRDRFPFPFVPRVFALGKVPVGTQLAGMFMGEWLSGYGEFHWSMDRRTGVPSMVLWDPESGRCVLDSREVASLMRQASMILTTYFDPVTSEHIFPWHHAAGDFVVRRTGSGVDVRLIAARGCRHILSEVTDLPDPVHHAQRAIEGLLLFFAQLTLRMRLDRDDGVGPVVWAPADFLPFIVKGFWEGLALGAACRGLPDAFSQAMHVYFATHLSEELKSLSEAVVETYPAGSEERRCLEKELAGHLDAVLRAVKDSP